MGGKSSTLKSNSRMNYKNENRWVKNAKIRQDRHILAELTKAERKTELHNLVTQAIEQYKMGDQGVYLMKRIIGTLNIHRVSLFLNGKIEFEKWFQARSRTKIINKLADGTKVPATILCAMKGVDKTRQTTNEIKITE